MAHLHGFDAAAPGNARCPGPDADVNADGYVDLVETRAVAGVTLVPLTDDPTSLELKSQGYMTVDTIGKAEYAQEIDYGALEAALQQKFDTGLDLQRRVIFIHGVPEGTTLPDTVQSLPDVPAAATLPVACAELNSPME